MSAPRSWLQLRHLSEATGVDRRTLKTWADGDVLPFTRFAGTGWRLFGADAIATLESMGIPVDRAILTIPAIVAPDDGTEED